MFTFMRKYLINDSFLEDWLVESHAIIIEYMKCFIKFAVNRCEEKEYHTTILGNRGLFFHVISLDPL